MCHQRLAARRPAPDRLTEFYLLMSLGGVVGGAFNALLAPVIFNKVWEYPLVLVLVGLARPWGRGPLIRTADGLSVVGGRGWSRLPPVLLAICADSTTGARAAFDATSPFQMAPAGHDHADAGARSAPSWCATGRWPFAVILLA